MSAHYAIAYLKTDAGERQLFDGVAQAWSMEVDRKLYVQPEGSIASTLQCHSPVTLFNEPARIQQVIEQYPPGVVVYPQKNGLYSLWFTALHTPMNILIESDPTTRADLTAKLERLEQTDDITATPDPDSNRVVVLLPRFLERLSQALSADVAFLLYMRNPAADATGIQFYQNGRFIDDHFERFYSGEPDLIEKPLDPDAVSRMFDGRFAWVLDYPVYHEDENWYERLDPYFAFPPEARLYLPFPGGDALLPLGMIYYERAKL
ncbi:MAG TPA: hypothetical protein VNO70_08920 [Blastocatellia bacterium]|nr:hypothetical protein [Blastocatellia bacterium]